MIPTYLPSASASASASSGPPTNFPKKDRSANAAQACDTCRARKHRCDEQRPKCGLCQKMKLECHFREVPPTKKDRTLVEILERIRALEDKVDRIMRSLMQHAFGSPQAAPASQSVSPFPVRLYGGESLGVAAGALHRYTSAAHRILTWPAIKELLYQTYAVSSELEVDGSIFLVQLQRESQIIPQDEHLVQQPFLGMQTEESRKSGGARVIFPDLDYNTMHELATSYFDTFNLIYPFMDRQTFICDTLIKVHTEGFDGGAMSVIALLIFALGELSQQGMLGDPVGVYNGRPSGLRGGTLERPPGLGLFNEARSRLGFVVADMELENVQIFLLSALYYGACSRRVEFWRMIIAASTTCQSLIAANVIDWDSQRGDLVKRAYWQCRITETSLRLELDLPLTPIQPIEDPVDQPTFVSPFSEADHRSNEMTYFEKHYEAHLALHHLCIRLYNGISDCANLIEDFPASNLRQISFQLDQWLSTLPPELKWPEGEPTLFPESTKVPKPLLVALDPSLTTSSEARPGAHLFSIDIGQKPEQYPYAYDIQAAFLRTRFYYAKYIVNRPFVYKALHFPDQVTSGDVHGIENCLKACIKWPIALSPVSRQKRVVPHSFCWTQAFFGILLILHLSQHVPPLRKVRETLGDMFERQVTESIGLMLDWIRDLKGIDPFAGFFYYVLKKIYNMEDPKREKV